MRRPQLRGCLPTSPFLRSTIFPWRIQATRDSFLLDISATGSLSRAPRRKEVSRACARYLPASSPRHSHFCSCRVSSTFRQKTWSEVMFRGTFPLSHSLTLSLYHSLTLTLPLSHPLTLSLYHYITLSPSPSHSLTLSPSHYITLSLYHALTISHPLTLSPLTPLTLPLSHSFTLSLSHPLTLSLPLTTSLSHIVTLTTSLPHLLYLPSICLARSKIASIYKLSLPLFTHSVSFSTRE